MICTAVLQTSVSSLVLGLDGKSVTVGPGENAFGRRIPNLPLRAGVYASAADSTTISAITLRGYENSSFFTVKSDQPDRTTNFPPLMNDLLAIKP